MKKPETINNKIMDLEEWLKNNPEHPNYLTVLTDKRNLKDQLLKATK